MIVTFQSFTRENTNHYAKAPNGVSKPTEQFTGKCFVMEEDAGTGFDIRLGCTDRLPSAFSLSSRTNQVALKINGAGIPTRMILKSFDKNKMLRFKVELELNPDGNPTGLKFYLPADVNPVHNEDELTDIRQARNDSTGSQIAGSVEVAEAMQKQPLLNEAFNCAEFHLTVAYGLLPECLVRTVSA